MSAVEPQVSTLIPPTMAQEWLNDEHEKLRSEWKNKVHEKLRFNIYGRDSHDMTKLDCVAVTISDLWTEAVAEVLADMRESSWKNADLAQKIIQLANWDINNRQGTVPSDVDLEWWESFVHAKMAKSEAAKLLSPMWRHYFYRKVIWEALDGETKETGRFTLYAQISDMESVRATENANAFLVEESERISVLRTM
jgi:hypothetical protein